MMRNVIIALTAFMFSGCVKDNAHFDKNVQIPKGGWAYNEPVRFKVEVERLNDTLDMYINVRHTRQYPWRNLWVEVNTLFPDKKTETDTRVNLKLESAEGETFGKCTGDLCFVQVPIQYRAVFPDTGIYVFTIEQSMRENPLKEVESVGLRLEREAK